MVKKTVVQYTLESCVNCMKCVRICPASALSLVDNRINIDDNRCINCMRCVRVCPEKGLQAHGSPLSEIENYDYTVCLVSGAISLHFPNKDVVEGVFYSIKNLGFDEVIDISDVEGLMMEETFRISDEMVTTSIITSFCPVLNRLVEDRYPMLLHHLAPLKYPHETAALVARARLKDKGKVGIFNLCPCGSLLSIAKYPYHNMQYETDHAIAMTDIIPFIRKDTPAGLPPVDLCRQGLQSINPALLPQRRTYLAADGYGKVTDIFNLAEFDLLNSFDLLYVFYCFNGCSGGDLMFGNSYLTHNNMENLTDGPSANLPDIPFENMYSEHMLLPENEQQNIADKLKFFRNVNEQLEQLPRLDCSACGFKTCRLMAEEIVNGRRTLHDCHILSARRARERMEKKGAQEAE